MKKFLVVIAAGIIFTLSSGPVDGQPCGLHCEPGPNGYIVCRARCIYPPNCEVYENLNCVQYCYYDYVGACFDGEYEPCCVPGAGGF